MPLERFTGIASRRMAGEDEFSFDLAVKAVEECLAYSRYGVEDIDLVVSCSISRFDGPDRYSFEPSTAARLRTAFGIHHALAFDVTNACAGMFTGIYLADALVRIGAIRRALVVSGEYITHLTETAQKEIAGLADPRLACLTLGDAGAAVIVDQVANGAGGQVNGGDGQRAAGLHAVDLYTLGRHSEMCVAKATEKPHGGVIMTTDMVGLARVAVTAFLQHAAFTVFRLGWAPESIQHVIPHQTSKSTLDGGNRSVQRATTGRDLGLADKLVINVAERGNTATTSHFVALKDTIASGRINSGDSILFGILASGITVGTALYRLDDLPDRIRARTPNPGRAAEAGRSPSRRPALALGDLAPRVRVRAVGLAGEAATATSDTLTMLSDAASRCLQASGCPRGDIDLVLCTSVYRSGYLKEPAVASLLAGKLGINDAPRTVMEKRSLAFDVLNGGLGFLDACCLATALIRRGNARTVLVATAEVENNAQVRPDHLRGIAVGGAAVLLDAAPDGEAGFGGFSFRSFPEHAPALNVWASLRSLKHGDGYVPSLVVEQDPELEELYARSAAAAAREFMESQGLDRGGIAVVLPPQISPGFIDRFAELLGVERTLCVDVTRPGVDLFTATLPCGLNAVQGSGRVARGDRGLIVNVAAGLEVGCAAYHF
ncbi:MAG: 3-oxoacyl-[acyl-carrier-protein] synthase III C-terminal domain-containing protein [Planctomycetota bacterium]